MNWFVGIISTLVFFYLKIGCADVLEALGLQANIWNILFFLPDAAFLLWAIWDSKKIGPENRVSPVAKFTVPISISIVVLMVLGSVFQTDLGLIAFLLEFVFMVWYIAFRYNITVAKLKAKNKKS